MVAPHDYVLDPVPAVPIADFGRATFDELLDVFAVADGVALVGASDAEMGPYTRCTRVPISDVDGYRMKGYRPLTATEQHEVRVMPDDFPESTD